MADGYSLDGYIEVPERIQRFKDKFPDGSLQGRYETVELGGQLWVIYIAKAYRTPDDERPGVGTAWEPFPGQTSFTKDSELMNAETSAWGRAIVALGFLAKDEKIASAQEVRNRQDASPNGDIGVSDKQLGFIERLAKEAGADDLPTVRAYCAEKLTGGREGSASKAIEALKGDGAGEAVARLSEAAEKWAKEQTDTPPDTEGLDAKTPDEAIPF